MTELKLYHHQTLVGRQRSANQCKSAALQMVITEAASENVTWPWEGSPNLEKHSVFLP